jgi:serine protease Do
MRLHSVCISACLAAGSLVLPSAFAQQPRPRDVQTYTFQMGGSYLGVGAMEVTSDRAKALGLKEERGVEISRVDPEGPAGKAGMKEGDVVLEFNGQPVQSYAQFVRMVQETPIGRQVKIVVWRGGAAQTLTATVGERKNAPIVIGPDSGWNFNMPAIPNMPEMPNIEIPRFGTIQSGMLGIWGESLAQEEQLAEFFGVSDGVLVRSVRKGSSAEKAGIKAGDVITKVDESSVSTSADITRALRNAKAKKTVTVIVVRNKKEMPLTVTVEPGPGERVRAYAPSEYVMGYLDVGRA